MNTAWGVELLGLVFCFLRQNDSERSVRLLLESTALAINDPRLNQKFGFDRYVVLNASLEPAEHLANSSAFVHVSALLSASNALATGLAILAVPIAAIPFEAQTLFFFRVIHSAHSAVLLLLP